MTSNSAFHTAYKMPSGVHKRVSQRRGIVKPKKRLLLKQNVPTDRLTVAIPALSHTEKRAIPTSALRKPLETPSTVNLISSPNGASPFSSSQGIFNDQSSPNKTPRQMRIVMQHTPSNGARHPSSDDNIFWAMTPDVNRQEKQLQPLDENYLGNVSMDSNGSNFPSSPLKGFTKKADEEESVAGMLDPDLKNMMEKYNHGQIKRQPLRKLPDLNRSSSDPNALKKLTMQPPGTMAPVIATRNTLSESMLQNIKKLRCSKRFVPSRALFLPNRRVNPAGGDKDVSELLAEIGTSLNSRQSSVEVADSLRMSNTPESATAVDSPIPSALKQPVSNSNSDSEDDFSDDVDMDELDKLATQVRIDREEHTQQSAADPVNSIAPVIPTPSVKPVNDDSDESMEDDVFTDDGEEALEIQRASQAVHPKTVTDSRVTDITQPDSSEGNECKELKESKEPSPFKDMKLDPETQKCLQEDSTNRAKACILKEQCRRYEILKIITNSYSSNGQKRQQSILGCRTGDDKRQNILVRDQWRELGFHEGDVIHVISDSAQDNPYLVDKNHNLLVWNPDSLISATMMSRAIECQRQAVLNQMYSGPGEDAIPLIVGNVVHAIFQACLSERDTSDDFIQSTVDSLMDENLMSIWSANSDAESVKKLLVEHTEHIKDWIATYLPSNSSTHSSGFKSSSFSLPFKVTNVLDVEEKITSPMFGLRGFIDVVIEARLTNGYRCVVPMEIKTGREYITHRAQVSLYTLLIKDRYNVATDKFSLVYTKMQTSYFEALKENDLRMLVNIRNQISQYLSYGVTQLPPVKCQQECERCHDLVPCMAIHKLSDEGDAKSSGINPELYESLTGHLSSPQYKDFFNRWNDAITKEEGLINRFKKSLWCSTADEREHNGGKALGGLHVMDATEVLHGPRKFLYTFTRDITSTASLMSSQIAKHDRIILSDEEGNYGLAYGFVEALRADVIVICADRRWISSGVHLDHFDKTSNQVFLSAIPRSQVSQNKDAGPIEKLQIDVSTAQKTYRIDKDEMFHGMATARFNILNLFASGGDERRRKLVVDLEAPRFSGPSLITTEMDLSSFNADQRSAFDRVCHTLDYSLILGMPGTGKTTVIATIIKALVEAGQSVLISSYTHSAVDNICEKLLDIMDNPSLVRLGYPRNISAKVRKYALRSAGSEDAIYDINSKEDFEKIIVDTQIVAATCLGVGDSVLSHRDVFDYCIIDEASQVSMPICLGPLALCDKFILVGDHYQLPPLVLNPEARVQGLDQSLFRILCESHPESVVELTHQYRMCFDIMTVSNTLIYDGRLKCGDDAVANRSLTIPYPERMPQQVGWMQSVFDPSRKVIFLNHDNIPAREVCHGDKIENPVEARLILQIVKALLLCGVAQESIGLMSFYKAQLRHFYRGLGAYKDIDVMTADRFQGRDKDCIIISLVRSNEKNYAGDLLREWRRVNVAMTRAKSKLIVLGSRKLMNTIAQFEGFMQLFEKKGWFLDLPPNADQIYESFLDFEGSTQKKGGSTRRSPQKVKVTQRSPVVEKDSRPQKCVARVGAELIDF